MKDRNRKSLFSSPSCLLWPQTISFSARLSSCSHSLSLCSVCQLSRLLSSFSVILLLSTARGNCDKEDDNSMMNSPGRPTGHHALHIELKNYMWAGATTSSWVGIIFLHSVCSPRKKFVMRSFCDNIFSHSSSKKGERKNINFSSSMMKAHHILAPSWARVYLEIFVSLERIPMDFVGGSTRHPFHTHGRVIISTRVSRFLSSFRLDGRWDVKEEGRAQRKRWKSRKSSWKTTWMASCSFCFPAFSLSFRPLSRSRCFIIAYNQAETWTRYGGESFYNEWKHQAKKLLVSKKLTCEMCVICSVCYDNNGQKTWNTQNFFIQHSFFAETTEKHRLSLYFCCRRFIVANWKFIISTSLVMLQQ